MESKKRTRLAVASSVLNCIHGRARASWPFIAIALALAVTIALAVIAIAIDIAIDTAAALSHRDDIF